jgi:hypothetical protein
MAHIMFLTEFLHVNSLYLHNNKITKTMKKISTLLFTLSSLSLMAQIPNPSFENWTSGAPNGWTVTSNPASTTVTESNNAHQGTHALTLNVVSLGGPSTVGGAVQSGGKSGYFLNTGNYLTVKGWYILSLANSSDQLLMYAGTKCSGGINSAGANSFFIDSNTAVYKEFSIALNYTNGCTADSMTIGFEIVNFSTFNPDINSWALIDDLSLGVVSAVDEPGNQVSLEEAYPNPASIQSNIIYSIPGSATVCVGLYDISGRLVEPLLNNCRQSSGRYKIPVNVSTLANGVYVYRVSVNGEVYSQKLIVEK